MTRRPGSMQPLQQHRRQRLRRRSTSSSRRSRSRPSRSPLHRSPQPARSPSQTLSRRTLFPMGSSGCCRRSPSRSPTRAHGPQGPIVPGAAARSPMRDQRPRDRGVSVSVSGAKPGGSWSPRHRQSSHSGACENEQHKAVRPVSSTLHLAPRRDTPTLATTSRGSFLKAAAAARDPECLHRAVGELERDMFAVSSAGPRDTWLKTWVSLHQQAHRFEPLVSEPFPLTVSSIRLVGALFKKGRLPVFRKLCFPGQRAPRRLDGLVGPPP